MSMINYVYQLRLANKFTVYQAHGSYSVTLLIRVVTLELARQSAQYRY